MRMPDGPLGRCVWITGSPPLATFREELPTIHPEQRESTDRCVLTLFPYCRPRWSGYLACKAEIRSSNSGRLRKLARLGSFRK